MENIKSLLVILTNALEKNNFDKDKQKIEVLCNSLRDIQKKFPSIIELEEINNDVNYLETKCDDFNDLSYYFTPLYIKLKNKIHEEKVKKIREENRRKRVCKDVKKVK